MMTVEKNEHLIKGLCDDSLVIKARRSSNFAGGDNSNDKVPSVASTAISSMEDSSDLSCAIVSNGGDDVDSGDWAVVSNERPLRGDKISSGIPSECFISNIENVSSHETSSLLDVATFAQDSVSSQEAEWNTCFVVERQKNDISKPIQRCHGELAERESRTTTKHVNVFPIAARQEDTQMKQDTIHWVKFKSDWPYNETLRVTTSERRQDLHCHKSGESLSNIQKPIPCAQNCERKGQVEESATVDETASLLIGTTRSTQDEHATANELDTRKGCKLLLVEISNIMKEIFVDPLFQPHAVMDKATSSDDMSEMSGPGDIFWDTPDIEVQVLPDLSSVSAESFINHSGSSSDDSEFDVNESASSTFLNHKVSWQRSIEHDATESVREHEVFLEMKENFACSDSTKPELCGNKISCDERAHVCFCRLWRFHSQLKELENKVCTGNFQYSASSIEEETIFQNFCQNDQCYRKDDRNVDGMEMSTTSERQKSGKLRISIGRRFQHNNSRERGGSRTRTISEDQQFPLLEEEGDSLQRRVRIPQAHQQLLMMYEGRQNICKTIVRSGKRFRCMVKTFHKGGVKYAAT